MNNGVLVVSASFNATYMQDDGHQETFACMVYLLLLSNTSQIFFVALFRQYGTHTVTYLPARYPLFSLNLQVMETLSQM